MEMEIQQVVDELIIYNNKNDASWMKAYKEVLNNLNLESRINDSLFLSKVVNIITEKGYDINDEPFKLEYYK